MNFGFDVEFSGGEFIIKEGITKAKISQVGMTKYRLLQLIAEDVIYEHIAQDEKVVSNL